MCPRAQIDKIRCYYIPILATPSQNAGIHMNATHTHTHTLVLPHSKYNQIADAATV